MASSIRDHLNSLGYNPTLTGLGSVAQGIGNGLQQGLQNKIAMTQLGYQNPDRPLGAKDILGLALQASKEQDLQNQMATATGHPELVKPFDGAGFIKNTMAMLNGIKAGGGVQQAAPVPSLPNISIPQGVGGAQPSFLSGAQLAQQNSANTPALPNPAPVPVTQWTPADFSAFQAELQKRAGKSA